jgi:hypothetical protein
MSAVLQDNSGTGSVRLGRTYCYFLRSCVYTSDVFKAGMLG